MEFQNNIDQTDLDQIIIDRDELDAINVLEQKMSEMDIPGAMISFEPDEAEELGAFEEDALSEEDAFDAAFD